MTPVDRSAFSFDPVMKVAAMLLAQAETIGKAADAALNSAADYGLIGILLVCVLLAIGGFILTAFRFLAPLFRDFVASTVQLHTSLQETTKRQTELLDEHKGKLSDIRLAIETNKCPYQPPKNPPGVAPIPFGV